jgi:hypothetical protein
LGYSSAIDPVAPMRYARWLIPPAALAAHLSIGQVYAFSVFKKPLVAHFDSSLTNRLGSRHPRSLGIAPAARAPWTTSDSARSYCMARLDSNQDLTDHESAKSLRIWLMRAKYEGSSSS